MHFFLDASYGFLRYCIHREGNTMIQIFQKKIVELRKLEAETKDIKVALNLKNQILIYTKMIKKLQRHAASK